MSKPKDKAPKAKRTTISLNPIVYAWAIRMAAESGHNSLSDFIADLIRRKQEEEASKTRYPENDPSSTRIVLEEKKKPAA